MVGRYEASVCCDLAGRNGTFKPKGVASLEFATLQNTTRTNTQLEVSIADFGHYVGKE